MTGVSNPLARGTPGVIDSARALKQWTREILGLPEEVVVSVNELACSLPDCPPKETVVLVLAPSRPPVQISIHAPLRDVSRSQLARALATM